LASAFARQTILELSYGSAFPLWNALRGTMLRIGTHSIFLEFENVTQIRGGNSTSFSELEQINCAPSASF
jgi:hypothetical protein